MSDDRLEEVSNRIRKALGVKPELPVNGAESTTVMHRSPNETLVEYTERAFGVKPESPVNGAKSTTVMHRGPNESSVEFVERALGVKPDSPANGAKSTAVMQRGPDESPVEFAERALGIAKAKEALLGAAVEGGEDVENPGGPSVNPRGKTTHKNGAKR